MKILVTFAVRSEFAPWQRRRNFMRLPGEWPVFEAMFGGAQVRAILTGMGQEHALNCCEEVARLQARYLHFDRAGGIAAQRLSPGRHPGGAPGQRSGGAGRRGEPSRIALDRGGLRGAANRAHGDIEDARQRGPNEKRRAGEPGGSGGYGKLHDPCGGGADAACRRLRFEPSATPWISICHTISSGRATRKARFA